MSEQEDTLIQRFFSHGIDSFTGEEQKAIKNALIKVKVDLYFESAQYPIKFDGRFGLPKKFNDFTGREKELEQLEGNEKQSHLITQKITGTGGIGKTQLAVAACYAQLQRYEETRGKVGCRSVIWFIAGTDEGVDNEGLMTEQCHRLGKQLGLDPKSLESPDLIKLIYKRLGKEHGPYLVVFDNAYHYTSIQPYLPPASVKVIVTTRNSNEVEWGRSFKSLSLGIFSDKDALDYIKKFLCQDYPALYQEEEAKNLAFALRFFPLTLTQALAYITTENISIRDYLAEFKQQKALYLKHPVPQDDHYQEDKNPTSTVSLARPKEAYDPQKATVWAVIQLSLKKVINPNAHQILKACAYLAPEAPIDLKLLSCCAANLTQCREAVSALRHYSLIENVILPNHVRIHQLVQEILRLDHKEVAQTVFLYCLAEIMGEHFDREENPLADEARRKTCFPHLLAMLEQIEKFHGADQLFEKIKARMQSELGLIYHLLGNPVEMTRYYQQALKVYEACQDEIRIARTLGNLGNALQELGDPTGAKALLERALSIQERTFGTEHPEVANILLNLGSATQALGDLVGAISLFKRVLAIYERTYGSEHPDVAITLGSLGNANRELGDAPRAKSFLERALAIQERTYGSEHPDVAIILGNLGIVTGRLRDYAGAKALLERALTIQEHTFGSKHPLVAKTLMNLGNATERLGNHAGAKALYERALRIQECTYGSEHPLMANTLMILGKATGQLGDHARAKTLYERALVIQERAYGLDHPDVAVSLGNLGNSTLKLGDAAGAIVLYKQALGIQERTYGLEHLQVAKTIANLGAAFQLLGDGAEAKALLERALPIFERSYGPEDSEVAKTLVTLGTVIRDLGDEAGAIDLYQRALVIQKSVYGPGHTEVAITCSSLAFALVGLSQTAAALQHFEQCYQIFHKNFGDHHPYTHEAKDIINDLKQHTQQGFLKTQSHSQNNLSTHGKSEALNPNNRMHQLLDRCKTEDPAQAIRRSTVNGTLADLNELLKEFPDHANQPDPTPKKGFTALHLAVLNNKVEQVGILLGCIGFTTTLDAQGLSALDYAIQDNNAEILAHFREALLKKYSEFQITSAQLPKLVRACAQHGEVTGLKLLIHLKVPCDEAGPKTGQTALHLAVIKEQIVCVKLLVATGADCCREDHEGQTPISLSENKPEIWRIVNPTEGVEYSSNVY